MNTWRAFFWTVLLAAFSGCGSQGSPDLRKAVSYGDRQEVIKVLREMSVSVRVDEEGQITTIDVSPQFQYVAQQFTDADCRQLARLAEAGHLDRLASLDFLFASVTDKGCRSLASLDTVRSLSLARTPVTDMGLQHLARMTELERLDLNVTKITGPGLQALSGLTNLRELRLGVTEIDDTSLAHLQDLQQQPYRLVLFF